jgi:hypothetical protein
MLRFIQAYDHFMNTCPLYKNHPSIMTQLWVDVTSANWLIPGRIMCGGYPGLDGSVHLTRNEAIDNLRSIVCHQIDTFVCLQHEITPQNALCVGETLYKDVFPEFENYAHTMSCNQIISHTSNELVFRYFPVIDQNIPHVREFLDHLADILNDLSAERNIYLHCAKGHGRTGTYAACLLACIFPYTTVDAILRYVQYAHDRRSEYHDGCYIPPASPNTQEQVAFTRKMCEFIHTIHNAMTRHFYEV